jgi:succinyl-CoA synthetase alpha subunit
MVSQAIDRAPENAGRVEEAPRSLAMAAARRPEANLALVSVPGPFAAAEALKALRLGLNVMVFSDNVDVADEVMLKAEARERGLLVMGPDCGTAIVDGVPLGFANAVRRGDIGAIGASGTGLQQVTCLIDRAGKGVSQAIGAGGRDLSTEVGGATTLRAIGLLGADPESRVIVMVSKPPAPRVAERVLQAARSTGKAVVACFLGGRADQIEREGVTAAETLEDAAATAVALSDGKTPRRSAVALPEGLPRPGRGRTYLRGLMSGGTFCYEALAILGERIGPVRSNAPIDKSRRLADPWRSAGHAIVDLGDDLFTRGRPHPMIDQRLRCERLVREAGDPETAVILFDVVLGHGAHPDPASELAHAVRAAREASGDGVVFVASVCGTEADPQRLSCQEATLRAAGVVLAGSNAAAVRIAAGLAEKARG